MSPAEVVDQQYAYFYISQNTPVEVIRSLVCQLVRTPNGCTAPFLSELSEHDLAMMSVKQYCEKLTELSNSMNAIVILDGIDECSDIMELVAYLVQLADDSRETFKLLLKPCWPTSQKHITLFKRFSRQIPTHFFQFAF